jgi:5-methyltetrahydrofolate--homocysteine methyltransferase
MDEVRARLTTWWNGGDIGRPAMQITAPREAPHEAVAALDEPEGWTGRYSTADFDYRVNDAARACLWTDYFGEAVPLVSPDLGPNTLALFLGCRGVESPGTVWFEPFIEHPETNGFGYEEGNFYWDFCRRLTLEERRVGSGRFLLQFPDLIEGLDTLAAMRGTEELLLDLVERPEWVSGCMRRITDLYFRYYDVLYDLMRDEVGGSVFWAWGPGRMVKLQCDFSAMISPAMFGEFMVPVLREMTERVGYSMYHWDGPGALGHHDHLLGVRALDMIQWTPGAGQAPTWDRQWWGLYHKTFDAGKKVLISCDTRASLRRLKAEFGDRWKGFLINVRVAGAEEAAAILRAAEE